ncbi:MAG: hypothetical protein IJ443_07330 [Firmicutes bacterium]|nr:hypothetical protein [Bacillota bacterium]
MEQTQYVNRTIRATEIVTVQRCETAIWIGMRAKFIHIKNEDDIEEMQKSAMNWAVTQNVGTKMSVFG